MTSPSERYDRNDLDELRTLDRRQILTILGSFEDEGITDGDFVKGMCGLLSPQLDLPDSADPDVIGRAVLAMWPRPSKTLAAPDEGMMAIARGALEHRFTFYDEEHQLPEQIDWDANPGTAHWGHDLNRFNFLMPLIRAHQSTDEPIYARKAIDLILDWIDKCEIERCFAGTPYVFGSYLNNAIHIQAWVSCLQPLLDTGLLTGREALTIIKSIQEQIAYLEIVTNGHGGNWPTIGCQGILATLAALPPLRDTDRFIDYCIDALATQIDDQILPDGVQDELTPHYHTVVVRNLLTAAESLQTLGRELQPRTLDALRRMIHYQEQAIVPDRSAQVAFNDSDPEVVPDLAGCLSQLGLQDAIPVDPGPEVFPYAGVTFLRQPPSAGDLYLAFDGGPFGRGHQHEDKLGFWLYAYGRNLIVDPGRHLYDQSAASYLPYLRSTRAHSTILIDGLSQHSKGRRDAWIATEPDDLHFETSPTLTRARSAYTLGYGEDNGLDVVHHREILFVDQRFWIVFDRLEGTGTHQIESRFQFAPGDLHLETDRVTTRFGDANLLLVASGEWEKRQVEVGQQEPERSGWYSASYNRIEPSPTLSLATTQQLPWSCAVLLYPFEGQDCPEVEFSVDDRRVAVIADGTEHEIQVREPRRPPFVGHRRIGRVESRRSG